MPLGRKSAAMRTGGVATLPAAPATTLEAARAMPPAGIIASSIGSAMVAPSPRSTVRLEIIPLFDISDFQTFPVRSRFERIVPPVPSPADLSGSAGEDTG